MGHCCSKNDREEVKLTMDMQKELEIQKSPESLEQQYLQIIKEIEIENPSAKVSQITI